MFFTDVGEPTLPHVSAPRRRGRPAMFIFRRSFWTVGAGLAVAMLVVALGSI
jgi:hypothetical protein